MKNRERSWQIKRLLDNQNLEPYDIAVLRIKEIWSQSFEGKIDSKQRIDNLDQYLNSVEEDFPDVYQRLIEPDSEDKNKLMKIAQQYFLNS